ncbi:MAG TPA: hypothetical protein VFP80_08700 [Thermoanaerobaculia bacterium]|nr:hypothetical protein [Thermoanaerobaculia bacterium]
MHRRTLSLVALMFALAALPLSASQFIDTPFDQMARESALIVRGDVVGTYSAWDDAHEVIYTYATVRVHRYFGEATGPDTLVVREVGGTVDGYTQEAIGFPAIRSGENVVLLLTQWDGSADYRIHAYNKGKFLVRIRAGSEVLVNDPDTQGQERLTRQGGGIRSQAADDDTPGLGIEEFSRMVEDARAGRTAGGQKHQNQ